MLICKAANFASSFSLSNFRLQTTDTNPSTFKRYVIIKTRDVDVKQINPPPKKKTTRNISCRGEQTNCVVGFRLDRYWCLAQHGQNPLKSLLVQYLI